MVRHEPLSLWTYRGLALLPSVPVPIARSCLRMLLKRMGLCVREEWKSWPGSVRSGRDWLLLPSRWALRVSSYSNASTKAHLMGYVSSLPLPQNNRTCTGEQGPNAHRHQRDSQKNSETSQSPPSASPLRFTSFAAPPIPILRLIITPLHHLSTHLVLLQPLPTFVQRRSDLPSILLTPIPIFAGSKISTHQTPLSPYQQTQRHSLHARPDIEGSTPGSASLS